MKIQSKGHYSVDYFSGLSHFSPFFSQFNHLVILVISVIFSVVLSSSSVIIVITKLLSVLNPIIALIISRFSQFSVELDIISIIISVISFSLLFGFFQSF